ncbi:MAG: coenzyme F420-0:L-glutamate ligase [Candidatus Hermodarchaeota archaeon]
MELRAFGVKTPIITPSTDILKTVLDLKLDLKDRDILIIASKVIAIAENSIRELKSVRPSAQAHNLAKKTDLAAEFVQIILEEADEILDYAPGVLLTLRKNILQANAGVDQSNAIPGTVTLLPRDPAGTALYLHHQIFKKTGKKVAIIISDSKTNPLRRGTSGIALGVAGMAAVSDERGKEDLFHHIMRITWRAIADNLVCLSQLIMGETAEQTPIVIVRGYPYQPVELETSKNAIIAPELCLYKKMYRKED